MMHPRKLNELSSPSARAGAAAGRLRLTTKWRADGRCWGLGGAPWGAPKRATLCLTCVLATRVVLSRSILSMAKQSARIFQIDGVFAARCLWTFVFLCTAHASTVSAFYMYRP